MKRRDFCQVAGLAAGSALMSTALTRFAFAWPSASQATGFALKVATSRSFGTNDIVIDFKGHVEPEQVASAELASGITHYWRATSSIGRHYHGHFDRPDDLRIVVDQYNALTLPFLLALYGAGVGVESEIPLGSELGQNYPNPFRLSTTIPFAIGEAGPVRLKVYNLLGQEVATLIDDRLPTGNHTHVWNASNLASGTYICVLEAGTFRHTRRLTVVN